MISAALNTLPATPGPASATQPGAPAEPAQDDNKPRPFARLLHAAGGTKDGRRPADARGAAGKPDSTQQPVKPSTQQAEPTADLPTDATALLATLPPLLPRPLPPASGNDASVRTQRDGFVPGSTRSPVDANGPVLTPPGTRDARPGSATPVGAATAFADALRDAGTAAADSRADAAKAAAAELPPLPPTPAQTPAATAVAASAPAEARIAATPGSADFASQLGAQLSTFVRDGVQHARLELHPVELGPVTVQIQLDGNTAQVNLAAEQAPTRAALEDALPQLAGSLREAGLTLTGGGVFEQPRQSSGSRGDGSAPTRESNTRSERDAARESVTLQPLAAPRRRGVVDLVA